MDEKEMVERVIRVEERSKNNTHRIDKLEPVIDEIHTMSKTMVQMVEVVKNTNDNVTNLADKVEKMDDRVSDMEKAPGKEWSNVKRTVFNTFLGAVVGFLVAGLVWASVQAFM